MLRSGSYFPASSGSAEQLRDHDAFLGAEFFPTGDECRQLAAPVAEFLARCSCYDMLGTSTQVVVLDVDVALTVAFVAAQETRLNTLVLWDSVARCFCGVMSSTDYIGILLYCSDHVGEAEHVSQCTIRQWREKQRCQEAPFVTCSTEMSLRNCLHKMHAARSRCVVVLSEKEAQDTSVVAVVDLEQILAYLGAMFLSIVAAGDGRPHHRHPHQHHSQQPQQQQQQKQKPCGGTISARAPFVRGGAEQDDSDSANFGMSADDVKLPLHVRNLLHAPADAELENPLMDFGKEPRVGPYRAIVDVPFCYVPALGRHREEAISVTMDTPLLDALRLMLQNDIETIAVVSEEQIIVDMISRCDVVRIEDQGVYDTKLSVREALGSKVSGKACVFHSKDSLRDIFVHFVRQRVNELFLVDPDSDKLIGQLNVAELVVFLVFGITTSNEEGIEEERS